MDRITIGKRVVVYGGTIMLICPHCARELPPESFYRSGPHHTLHRRSWCIECLKPVHAAAARGKYQRIPRALWKPGRGWPKGKPHGPQPRARGGNGMFTKMATVEEARAAARERGWIVEPS